MIRPTIDKARQCLSENGWELTISNPPASDDTTYTVHLKGKTFLTDRHAVFVSLSAAIRNTVGAETYEKWVIDDWNKSRKDGIR